MAASDSRTTAAGAKSFGLGFGRLEATDYLFYGYLLLLVLEFVGLGRHIPILKVTRFSTILAWVLFLSVLKRVGFEGAVASRQSQLLAAFVAFNAFSVLIAVVQAHAFTAFRTHLDYFGLFVVTVYLVDRPKRIRQFAIVVSLIVVVLIARNAEKVVSSERVGSFRAGHFLSNGNDFAWGLTVMLPLAMYLVASRQGFIWRMVGLAGAGAAAVGIVGTQSRGAAIAFGVSALFYWAFVMKRKSLGVAGAIAGVVVLVMLAPPQYFQRLESIRNYEEDNSAMSRLQVWRAATFMAIDYPFGVGGGNFASAYGRYYIPDADDALRRWAQNKWMSAHSVYFRLLGEYGILGVIWIGVVLWTVWRENWATHNRLKGQNSDDVPIASWPLLINMSLIGYALSGVFLGGVAYPHIYLISGLTVATARQSLMHTAVSATQAPALLPGGAAATVPAAALADPRHPAFGMNAIARRAQLMMDARRRAQKAS